LAAHDAHLLTLLNLLHTGPLIDATLSHDKELHGATVGLVVIHPRIRGGSKYVQHSGLLADGIAVSLANLTGL